MLMSLKHHNKVVMCRRHNIQIFEGGVAACKVMLQLENVDIIYDLC